MSESFMPKKYYWPLAILGGLIIWTACKKEVSREGEPPVSTCSYAPYSDGSVYNFENVNNRTQDTTRFTVSVTGDTVIGGQVYKRLTSDTATTYDHCDGGNYHQLVRGISYEGYTADSVMSIYLKDNVVAGTSWSDTVTVKKGTDQQSVYLTYTVMQKNITKRVYDLDYTDVISVRLSAAVKVLGIVIDLGTLTTNYYAKGIGIIQIDQPTDTTRLRSYNIEP